MGIIKTIVSLTAALLLHIAIIEGIQLPVMPVNALSVRHLPKTIDVRLISVPILNDVRWNAPPAQSNNNLSASDTHFKESVTPINYVQNLTRELIRAGLD